MRRCMCVRVCAVYTYVYVSVCRYIPTILHPILRSTQEMQKYFYVSYDPFIRVTSLILVCGVTDTYA